MMHQKLWDWLLMLPQTPDRWPWWDPYIGFLWSNWRFGKSVIYYDYYNHVLDFGPLHLGWIGNPKAGACRRRDRT